MSLEDRLVAVVQSIANDIKGKVTLPKWTPVTTMPDYAKPVITLQPGYANGPQGNSRLYIPKYVGSAERAPGNLPSSQGADSKTLDRTGSTYFRYPGTDLTNLTDFGYSNDEQWLLGDFVSVSWQTSAPTMDIAFSSLTGANFILGRVYVDGQRLSNKATWCLNSPGTADNTITLTFPTARSRVITIYGLGTNGMFGGVSVPAGYTVTKPAAPKRPILFITDSYGGGHNTVQQQETMMYQIADALGADEVCASAIGGTGFTTDNKFLNRLNAWLPLRTNWAAVVVLGGRNDGEAGLQAAVTAVGNAIGSTIPSFLVSTQSTGATAIQNAMAAGCAATSMKFVKVDTDALPKVGSVDGSNDYVHPSFAGHVTMANTASTAIARLLSGPVQPVPSLEDIAAVNTRIDSNISTLATKANLTDINGTFRVNGISVKTPIDGTNLTDAQRDTLTNAGWLVITGGATSAMSAATYRWQASDLNLTDGATIGTWSSNVSGKDLITHNGNSPVYSNTGSFPYVMFDGANDAMKFTADGDLGGSVSLFVVMELRTVVDGFYVTDVKTNGGSVTGLTMNWSGTNWAMYATENDSMTDSGIAANTSWHIFHIIVSGTSIGYRIDGGDYFGTNGGVNAQGLTGGFALGGQVNGNVFFSPINVAEVGLFKRDMAEGEPEKIVTELKNKYGIN